MDPKLAVAFTAISAASAVLTTVTTVILAGAEDETKPQRVWAYKVPIPYTQGNLDWEAANEVFVKEMMRFTKAEMDEILPHLGLESIKYRRRYDASPEVALAVLCMRLSYPERLKTMIHHFGHSRSWISTIFNDVIMHLARRYKKKLHWDSRRLTYDQCLEYAQVIKRAGGGHCFWGYIDGTANEICRPTFDQQESYSGHKKMHAFNYQAIVTPDGLLSSLMGPFVGKRSDHGMMRSSNLENDLQNLNDGCPVEERLFLYGDPAYQGCWGIMGAYKSSVGHPITSIQKRFNVRMSRLRIEVEHAFAIHANTWQLFTKTSVMKIGSSPATAYYLIAVLMSNITNCLRGNQTSRRLQCSPPTLEEYLYLEADDTEVDDDAVSQVEMDVDDNDVVQDRIDVDVE